MKKVFYDFIIVAGVVLTYIILAAFQPGTNTIMATVNASIDPAFPDMKAAVNSYPLWSWFLPGLIGLVTIIINHKSTDA